MKNEFVGSQSPLLTTTTQTTSNRPEAVSFGLYNFLYNFNADYLSPFHIIYDKAGTYANSYLV